MIVLGAPSEVTILGGATDTEVVEVEKTITALQIGAELPKHWIEIVGLIAQVLCQRHKFRSA